MSFGKLLLLAVILIVVWYGFKYAARVETMRQSPQGGARRRRPDGTIRGGSAHGPEPVEDLVKCRQCSAFVAASGAANCGKPQCPWGS
ncbi:MAG TPA: hypothetical protein VKV32_07900 [Stellaceae bacterium]|nr:hypothetical protein [Stellaceae bacterium]